MRKERKRRRTSKKSKGKVGKHGKSDLFEKQRLEEKLSRPVSSLKLSGLYRPAAQRALNVLKRKRIETLGDLVQLSEEELQGIKHVGGKKTITVLKKELSRLGLSLPKTTQEKNLRKHIDELELSIRASNCLDKGGINHVYELVQFQAADLLRGGILGGRSLEEVKGVLARMGLSLGMKVDEYGFKKPVLFISKAIQEKNLRKQVDKLDLTVRTLNCLEDASIYFVHELVQLQETDDLFRLRSDGRKVLMELKDILATMGLSLGMKIDRAFTSGIGGSEVPTVKETIVLETDRGLSELQKVVEGAKNELNKLLETVNPHVVARIKEVLDLFKFSP